jgi:hypothetical protein
MKEIFGHLENRNLVIRGKETTFQRKNLFIYKIFAQGIKAAL